MMDIVYFLAEKDGFYDYAELRHSLRSLAKHVSDVGQVFVFGPRPAWLRQAVHRPVQDPYSHNKDANIIRKMHLVCLNADISDPFLFVNDDHFFTRNCLAGDFPYYHRGELPLRGRGDYPRRLANTHQGLKARGLGTLNFDVHAPILIQKGRFLSAFRGWDWVDRRGAGVVMKSVYGNSWPEIVQAAEFLDDLKMNRHTRGTAAAWLPRLAERPCFSVSDHVPRLVWQLWEELYPAPSPFE